jgi:hypothetical protein
MPRAAALALCSLAFVTAIAACDAPATTGPGDERPAGAGGKADSTGGSCGATPPLVQLVDNSRAAGTAEPAPTPLPQLRDTSEAALADALDRLADATPLAEYPFSGCHDRAHVTYLRLAAILGSDRVAKIWVFSPRLLTVGLSGAIESPVDEDLWDDDVTRWDYHVAAIVQTSNGVRVVDPVLAPVDEAMTIDEWFGHMSAAPGSAYTLADGRNYSFFNAGPSNYSGGRQPMNGAMFRYDGFARSDRWLEKNLARDAVATALVEGGASCPSLRSLLLQPQALYDALVSAPRPGAGGCRPFVQQFDQEVARWTDELEDLGAR